MAYLTVTVLLASLPATLAFAPLLLPASQDATSWTCSAVNAPTTLAPGASWRTLNCSSPKVPVFGPAGPLIVNVMEVDLSAPGLRLVPVAAPASPAPGLASLDAIAAADGRNLLAGINGGYFWRVDVATFFDGVCVGKARKDAEQPASAENPNFGLGDCSMVAGGKLVSSNCNCFGFNRPALLSINASATSIALLTQGQQAPGLELDSISAGPLLLTSNSSGTSIAIPSDDENIGNILEHSANTAFGLTASGSGVFVTTDGHDGCPLLDASCGANAYTLAYLLRDALNVTSAMAMDQGGSTTMWIKGQPHNGIVSNPGSGGARAIYNGLFLLQE